MNIPFALQLATGWTKLNFFINFISAIVQVPLMIGMTKLYGALGAASIWVILNIGYVLFSTQIMHKRLLKTEKWRWYCEDIIFPLAVSLAIAGAFRLFVPSSSNAIIVFIYLVIISGITMIATALSTQATRDYVYGKVSITIF